MFKDIKKLGEIIKDISYVLTQRQKLQCIILLILIIAGSFMDTLGVAMVWPFAQALMHPRQLEDNSYLAVVLDGCGIDSSEEIVLFTGVVLMAIYIAKNIVLAFIAYKRTALRWNMQRELQVRMLESYMTRPYTYYLDMNTGSVLTGLVNDVNNFYIVLEGLFNFFSYAITVIMIGIGLCIFDFLMAMLMLLVVGCCFLGVTVLFRKLLDGAGQRQRAANAETYKYASQSIIGIKEIFVMRCKGFFVRKYDEAIRKSTKENVRFFFLNSCPRLIIETFCICFIVLAICIRYASGNVDEMFMSKMAVFIVAAFRILPLIASINNVANSLVFYRTGVRNTYNNIKEAEKYIAEEQAYIYNRTVGVNITSVSDDKKNLEIKNIRWRYPGADREVLKGLSFTVKNKKSVAIIGASGAGKTTVSDIVMGLYKPQKGTVRFAGEDIYAMPDQWAKMVGYVPQSLFLIDDTIRANITFGVDEKNIDDNKIWDAIKKAQLKAYVKDLPQGLDTVVGERGIKLSGGQRQRIAIARALYRDPEILIFDEATSALDNETERAVMEAIDSLQGTKTMIIIAHRLSTIRNCDVVYEIKDGVAVPGRL